MDWVSMILSGMGALIGALAGGMLALILSPVLSFLGDSLKRLFKSLLILGGLLAGLMCLPFYIGPPLEPYLAQFGGDDTGPLTPIEIIEPAEDVPDSLIAEAIEKEIADLGDPFFEAVLAREPSRAQSVKTRLVAAYRQGGRERLVAELLRADQEIIKTAFPFYMARAQEADLIDAVEEISATIKVLGAADAQTCYLWLYGGLVGRSFDYDRYIEAVGEEGHFALQQKLAKAVIGADDFLPDYDEDAAFRALSGISETLMGELGPEKIGLITAGQEPEGEGDAQTACDASARFYDLILAEDNAADVLRYRYISSGI